ncbi:MAG TPA: serine hydrolase [Chryseosolibacter sp.]|nr:serine hydrolase [Chryseosolibacter sp.]
MRIRTVIKRTFLIIILAVLVYAISWIWRAAPIITGYGAKNLCSCVMVAGRDPEDVLKYELGRSPIRFGNFTVDMNDSSATGSLFGLAKRKAIYRKGLGCSLMINTEEENVDHAPVTVVAPPVFDADTIPWPAGNQIRDSLFTGVDLKRLNLAIDSAFFEPGKEKLRRTRAVIVVYQGNIIAERYAPPFTADSKLVGWSMTKSITNALVGILVGEGKLRIDDPAPVPQWNADERKNITLNHLMHASTGLAWEENYSGPSAVTNMLFKEKDMGRFAASCPLEHPPGETFYYSSGTTNIISRIIRESVGDPEYYRLPYEKLFYPIGMYNTVIEADAGGTFVGSSYSFGTARDWARFGLLYLNDGVWNGKRILPAGWVRYTVTPAPAAKRGEYGAQFWLNSGEKGNSSNRMYPAVPSDMFWADGFEGQNVFIIPSKKLVVVKLGLSHGDYVDDNMFLAALIAALPE